MPTRISLGSARSLVLAGSVLFTAGHVAWAGDCRGTKPSDKPKTDLPNNLAAVRAGQLAIEKGEKGFGDKVLLNDCRLALPAAMEESMSSLDLVTEPIPLPDEDVVLIMENTGGTACPTYWFLLHIKPDGATDFSQQFGTCSDTWKYEYKGDRLDVVIGESGDEQHVVYQKGRMSCDTCEKPTSTKPVVIDGHRLEIRKPKGQLAELLADSKPVGVQSLALAFVGEPFTVGSEGLVLVQRGAIKGSCSTKYVFVVRKADGSFRVSDEFGNCTKFPNPEPVPGGLRVTFPAAYGHPRQEVFCLSRNVTGPLLC